MNNFSLNEKQIVTFMAGGLFSADPGWKHKSRYHHGDYELMICLKGPIHLQVGENNMTLNSNDVLMIPPFTLMKGTESTTTSIEFYWLHFLSPQSKFQVQVEKQLTVNPMIALSHKYHLNNIDSLLISVHELLTVDSTLTFSQNQQDLLITLILIKLANSIGIKNDTGKNNALVAQLKEWIRTNIYRSPSLDDIASVAELNPQYVSRLFKKHVGMSPKHYMIHLKIQTAQVLLIRTNLSIKEVSNYAYYSDDKLFLKQFKKLSGVTPS
ncbi:AraC family transcriptional regulator [Lentilactobacillus kisonensis]|nr:AraC family transcriptional regulator [Lentilactobacillus kisonensis]EHO52388.1 transcriptional regulator, AraC family [Lentilactobacillus kisonensis F0435]